MKPGRVKRLLLVCYSVDWFTLLFELPRVLFFSFFVGPFNNARRCPFFSTSFDAQRVVRALRLFNPTELGLNRSMIVTA